MDIFLDKRAMKRIVTSVADAIEDGDMDTVREDIMDAFQDSQVEQIERHLQSGDFFEFLTETLDEWSGDDVEELLELLEAQLSEVGIELRYAKVSLEEEEDELEEEEDEIEEEEDGEDDDVLGLEEPSDEL